MKKYKVYQTSSDISKFDEIEDYGFRWINPKYIEHANYPRVVSTFRLNGKPFKAIIIHMVSGDYFIVSEKDFKGMIK